MSRAGPRPYHPMNPDNVDTVVVIFQSFQYIFHSIFGGFKRHEMTGWCWCCRFRNCRERQSQNSSFLHNDTHLFTDTYCLLAQIVAWKPIRKTASTGASVVPNRLYFIVQILSLSGFIIGSYQPILDFIFYSFSLSFCLLNWIFDIRHHSVQSLCLISEFVYVCGVVKVVINLLQNWTTEALSRGKRCNLYGGSEIAFLFFSCLAVFWFFFFFF